MASSSSALDAPKSNNNLAEEDLNSDRSESVELTVESRVSLKEKPFSWTAYTAFLLLGVSMLLPWNSTINSTTWLKGRLQHTPLLGSFLNWIGAVNTWVTLAVGLISFLMPRPRSSTPRRFDSIQLALFVIAAVFVADTLLTLVPLEPYALFASMLLLLTISTVAAGILQLDVFALVGAEYPPVMMQGIAMGQVMCAVCLSLFSMSAVALDYMDGPGLTFDNSTEPFKHGKHHSGDKNKHPSPSPSPSPPAELEGRAWWLYFFLCFVPVATTIVLYSHLDHSKARRYQLEDTDYEDDYRDRLVDSEDPEDDDWNSQVDEDDALIYEARSFDSAPKPTASSIILWEIRFLSLSVFLTFATTLALYPALTAAVVPSQPGARPMYTRLFVPLGFLCSGVGDWIGRSIPARPSWILTNQPLILALTASRAGFLFLFAGCNVGYSGSDRPSPIPPIFAADFWFFFFVALFFVSHGYLSTVALMQAPGCVEHMGQEAKGTAGALMSLVLFGGLAVGSVASFGVRWFIFGEIL